MNKSKKTSPINNLESVQYIFCVECENYFVLSVRILLNVKVELKSKIHLFK